MNDESTKAVDMDKTPVLSTVQTTEANLDGDIDLPSLDTLLLELEASHP